MQRKKGSKRIERNIKMVIEFKLTVVHFARPNPMHICTCAWIYRWTKKLWKIRTGPPGLRAAGQPGRWASGARGRGPRLGLRTAGPRGRRGPRDHGPWAAGLLLAKPTVGHTNKAVILTPGLFIERNYAAVSFNNLCRT